MLTKIFLVKKAKLEDVYQDIVRIPEIQRSWGKAQVVSEGTLCRITNGQNNAYAFVRGMQNSEEAVIYADERTRNLLGVQLDRSYAFRLKPVGLLGRARWSLNAADTAYRVASQIALISAALGVLGLLLGIASLVFTLRK